MCCAGGDDAGSFPEMQVQQSGNSQQNLARPLGERQGQRRLRGQARDRRKQQVTALLPPERTRNGKRGAANRLPQAFELQ